MLDIVPFQQETPALPEKALHLEPSRPLLSLGAQTIDGHLEGGLQRAAVHEIFARRSSDASAAAGVTLGLAQRAAGTRCILIARHDALCSEAGHFSGMGLLEFGIDPSRIILVQARNIEGVLRAGEQGARCSALGAVVIESLGNPKILDLKASRRLSLAASKSGVPVFMLRVAASSEPSAAVTRWEVSAEKSRPLLANAPGQPAFILHLSRHRRGLEGRTWHVEWNRDRTCFEEHKQFGEAALPRTVVSVSQRRPAASDGFEQRLRAG